MTFRSPGLVGGVSLASPYSVSAVPNPSSPPPTDAAMVIFPDNISPAIAIALEGDAYPRWLWMGDSSDGLYIGDGRGIYGEGAGDIGDIFVMNKPTYYNSPRTPMLIVWGGAKGVMAQVRVHASDWQTRSPDATLRRFKVANDGTLSSEVV